MKVKELIKNLKNYNPEDEVVIERKVKSYIGTIPYYDIGSIYNGIDWEAGKVYLIKQEPKWLKFNKEEND